MYNIRAVSLELTQFDLEEECWSGEVYPDAMVSSNIATSHII